MKCHALEKCLRLNGQLELPMNKFKIGLEKREVVEESEEERAQILRYKLKGEVESNRGGNKRL